MPPSEVFYDVESPPDVPMLEVSVRDDLAALPDDRFWIAGQLLIPARATVVHVGGRLAYMLAAEDQ
jgi:hypothetical protein